MQPLSGSSSLPAIHLAFVLLVIAWVVHPAAVVHGPVLPVARTAERLDPGLPRIGIDSKGAVYFEDRPYRDASSLTAALKAHFRQVPVGRRAVALSLDRDAAYSRVLDLVDAASAAGVGRIEMLADCPARRESHWRGCNR